jgi:hypothetical protein
MKKVIRLTEKDVERMVKKILKEDWRKGGWQDGQGKPGWLEDENYSDSEFERRKMNDEDLDQPYPTPEEDRGWQDGDGEPPLIDEDYMDDIDFEDLERKLRRNLDYSKKEVSKGVHYVDDPESFEYGKQLTGPKNLWWGYKHTSGTYQAKRYFSSLDIVEAEDSPFCEMVVGPFEAEDRDDALRQVKELTN